MNLYFWTSFKEYRIKILLQIIKDKKILKRNGIILIHREKIIRTIS